MIKFEDSESSPLVIFERIPTKPDKRSIRDKRAAVLLIFGAIVLERLVFYALAGNLSHILISESNTWEYPNSLILTLIFIGDIIK